MKNEQMNLNVLNGGFYMNTFKMGLFFMLSMVSLSIFGMKNLTEAVGAASDEDAQIAAYEKIKSAIDSASNEELEFLDGYYQLRRVIIGFKGEQLKRALKLKTNSLIKQLQAEKATEEAEELAKQETEKLATAPKRENKALAITQKLELFLKNNEEKVVSLCEAMNAEVEIATSVEERLNVEKLAKLKLVQQLMALTKERDGYKDGVDRYEAAFAKISSKLTQ